MARSRTATLADIKKLEAATSADIKRLEAATLARLDKADARISQCASKSDLALLDRKVDNAIFYMLQRFDQTASKSDISDLRQSFDRLVTAVDGMAGKLDDQSRAIYSIGHMLGEHRGRLDGHETRIGALESRP